MKPISALVLAVLAASATFVAQNDFFPPRLHAAPYIVPTGSDWRQQMIDRYPGGTKVDHVMDRLSGRLDLSRGQSSQVRSILLHHHDHILALLIAGPKSMTRGQFVAQERQAWAQTRKQLDAVLTPEQRQLAEDLSATS